MLQTRLLGAAACLLVACCYFQCCYLCLFFSTYPPFHCCHSRDTNPRCESDRPLLSFPLFLFPPPVAKITCRQSLSLSGLLSTCPRHDRITHHQYLYIHANHEPPQNIKRFPKNSQGPGTQLRIPYRNCRLVFLVASLDPASLNCGLSVLDPWFPTTIYFLSSPVILGRSCGNSWATLPIYVL